MSIQTCAFRQACIHPHLFRGNVTACARTCNGGVDQSRNLGGERFADAGPGRAEDPVNHHPQLRRVKAGALGALHDQVFHSAPSHAAALQHQLLKAAPVATKLPNAHMHTCNRHAQHTFNDGGIKPAQVKMDGISPKMDGDSNGLVVQSGLQLHAALRSPTKNRLPFHLVNPCHFC
jgi:hypothetical protein